MGNESGFNPIWPVGMDSDCTKVGGFFTTLLIWLPETIDPPEQELKLVWPFVDGIVPWYDLAMATPWVSLKSTPNSDKLVVDAQNSPKSNPLPAFITVESAYCTKSLLATYPYHLPSVAWAIRIV